MKYWILVLCFFGCGGNSLNSLEESGWGVLTFSQTQLAKLDDTHVAAVPYGFHRVDIVDTLRGERSTLQPPSGSTPECARNPLSLAAFDFNRDNFTDLFVKSLECHNRGWTAISAGVAPSPIWSIIEYQQQFPVTSSVHMFGLHLSNDTDIFLSSVPGRLVANVRTLASPNWKQRNWDHSVSLSLSEVSIGRVVLERPMYFEGREHLVVQRGGLISWISIDDFLGMDISDAHTLPSRDLIETRSHRAAYDGFAHLENFLDGHCAAFATGIGIYPGHGPRESLLLVADGLTYRTERLPFAGDVLTQAAVDDSLDPDAAWLLGIVRAGSGASLQAIHLTRCGQQVASSFEASVPFEFEPVNIKDDGLMFRGQPTENLRLLLMHSGVHSASVLLYDGRHLERYDVAYEEKSVKTQSWNVQ